MISPKNQVSLFILLLSAVLNSGSQQAFAGNENRGFSARVESEQVVASTVPSAIVVKAHTGSKLPSSVNMVVGQELLFKGNGAVDLMTLRYHQVSMHYAHDGNDALKEVPTSGYKSVFLAVAPGETTLDVGSNTMFYGLLPWGSRSIQVNVVPAQSVHSVAQTAIPE